MGVVREKWGGMISTWGTLSPQGSIWAAAKSKLQEEIMMDTWTTSQTAGREAAQWGQEPGVPLSLVFLERKL